MCVCVCVCVLTPKISVVAHLSLNKGQRTWKTLWVAMTSCAQYDINSWKKKTSLYTLLCTWSHASHCVHEVVSGWKVSLSTKAMRHEKVFGFGVEAGWNTKKQFLSTEARQVVCSCSPNLLLSRAVEAVSFEITWNFSLTSNMVPCTKMSRLAFWRGLPLQWSWYTSFKLFIELSSVHLNTLREKLLCMIAGTYFRKFHNLNSSLKSVSPFVYHFFSEFGSSFL